MKKILTVFAIFAIFASATGAFAYEIDNRKNGKEEALLGKIAFRLLNANRIQERIVVSLSDKKDANACSRYKKSQIIVNKGVIITASDEDEIAAVIAHEISHAIDYRQGIFRGYFSYFNSLNSKNYEYKADKRGVDFLVKAGYNPVAMITILNRIAPEPRYDWNATHPLTSRRLATIYEYIYAKYPQYLVQNEYINHPSYQNFLITSKENRKKLEQKIKSNSNRKVNYL